MKKLALMATLVLALVMASCTNNQSKSNTSEVIAAEGNTTSTTDFYGAYEGVLPCADCPGIKTVLTLRDDTTYDLSTKYLEKGEGAIETSGVYTLEEDVITLITPSTNEETYYKILDEKLALLNPDKQLNEGELADKYILTKK